MSAAPAQTVTVAAKRLLDAVLAAKEKGRDVAVHAHGTLGILRAARAGVRSVERASMLDDEARVTQSSPQEVAANLV